MLLPLAKPKTRQWIIKTGVLSPAGSHRQALDTRHNMAMQVSVSYGPHTSAKYPGIIRPKNEPAFRMASN